MQTNSQKDIPNLFTDKKKIYHVLRENNEKYDILAIKEASLELGVLIYANGELKQHHIP